MQILRRASRAFFTFAPPNFVMAPHLPPQNSGAGSATVYLSGEYNTIDQALGSVDWQIKQMINVHILQSYIINSIVRLNR